jgi:hypothetical protein
MGEIVLLARSDLKDDKPTAFSPFEFVPFAIDSVANDKGEFMLSSLEPARYYVETRLPDETLYTRSLALQSGAANQKAAGLQNGIRLKQGERLTGLTVTIAEGASGLAGKITAAGKEQPLPTRMRAHLIPAEAESPDDFLRFREVIAEADGSFAFTNIAPGRYRVVAREIADSETVDDLSRPMAWDEQGRGMLRRESESAATIELQPCQRVKDYALRSTPAAKQPAK